MPSMLDDYMKTYGTRLQSVLTDTQPAAGGAQTFPLGTNPSPPMRWEDSVPSSALVATDTPTVPIQRVPTPGVPAAIDRAGGIERTSALADPDRQSVSFQQHWEQTPSSEKKRFVNDLEETLKRGNQTIDSAFDQMVAHLGARPSGKLSREDKGMLLMEFGLALMANSARNRYGDDIGGAIGASGLQTLGRARELGRGRQREYDEKRAAIEGQRAKSKSALAEATAIEDVRGARADAAAARRESELTGTIEAEQGIYGRTRGGEVSALRDPESGEQLTPRPRATSSEPLVAVLEDDGTEIWVPRSEAAGRKKRPPGSGTSALSGLKSSDSNTLYRQAAGLFGGMFDPMTGRISGLSREQTQMVQQIAARGGDLFLAGEKNHAKAINQAFEEIRSGTGSNSALAEPDAVAADAPRKTIGGKTYVKIDGQWYEEN